MTNPAAAAERLRRANRSCIDYAALCEVDAQIVRDSLEFAEHYLSEHLPDDGEAITREWWDIVADDGTDLKRLHFGEDKSFWLDWIDECVWMESPTDSVDMPHITTRGQLRLLLRALGITGEGE